VIDKDQGRFYKELHFRVRFFYEAAFFFICFTRQEDAVFIHIQYAVCLFKKRERSPSTLEFYE